MIRNAWYVGCASSQLGQLRNEPVASRVLDQKLVLFRDGNGVAHALLDRCCHRGFPLSRGKIVDGRIECGYHGWQYEGGGRCVRVPSQAAEKSVPQSYCVPNFRCVEKDGYVWVWPGTEEPRISAVPAFAAIAKGKWAQGSRIIRCNYQRALEITFDGTHLYFVHPTHPATVMAKKHGMAEGKMEVVATETGCVYQGPVFDDDDSPRGFSIEFVLPGTIRFSGAGFGDYMIFHTTPIDETTCRMDWTLTNFNPTAADGVAWTAEGGDIIEEDQRVLEAIQQTYAAEGEKFERSVEADLPTLTLRSVVKLAEKGEWNGKEPPFPKRRVFSAMGPAAFDM